MIALLIAIRRTVLACKARHGAKREPIRNQIWIGLKCVCVRARTRVCAYVRVRVYVWISAGRSVYAEPERPLPSTPCLEHDEPIFVVERVGCS